MAYLFAYVSIFLLVCGSANAQQASQFCAYAWHEFSNCLRFLTGLYPQYPSRECCDAVRTLNLVAQGDELAPGNICQCIQDMASVYRIPFVASLIQDLPIKCNAHLSFPISNSMDCTHLN
ncbi:hypothetical protein PRUPE_3G134200 [Prunus persica]|uniref:Bifunctional inhibitor/plant lipid transfer protein/seed storage helical domain-containing protein n=1 Tax=Prunus persica TaxID=3760 RepID=A0A251PZP4_PRUPE|nr:hypothetical protein PRUPE_3G134200 [Prunus persica]